MPLTTEIPGKKETCCFINFFQIDIFCSPEQKDNTRLPKKPHRARFTMKKFISNCAFFVGCFVPFLCYLQVSWAARRTKGGGGRAGRVRGALTGPPLNPGSPRPQFTLWIQTWAGQRERSFPTPPARPPPARCIQVFLTQFLI